MPTGYPPDPSVVECPLCGGHDYHLRLKERLRSVHECENCGFVETKEGTNKKSEKIYTDPN